MNYYLVTLLFLPPQRSGGPTSSSHSHRDMFRCFLRQHLRWVKHTKHKHNSILAVNTSKHKHKNTEWREEVNTNHCVWLWTKHSVSATIRPSLKQTDGSWSNRYCLKWNLSLPLGSMQSPFVLQGSQHYMPHAGNATHTQMRTQTYEILSRQEARSNLIRKKQ